MKSLKAIFRRQKEQGGSSQGEDLSRASSISNLNADSTTNKGGTGGGGGSRGALAKVRKSVSKDKLNENIGNEKRPSVEKKGCNRNNNQLDLGDHEGLDVLQQKIEVMSNEKANLMLQLGDQKGQLSSLQKEISRLKMFQEQSSLQMEQLNDENMTLRNKLRDVVHSPLSDTEKQMILLDSQRHHSSAPASIAANLMNDSGGGDATTCSTPDWDKQSSSNVSEVSVACLQDKINQMQETHYSTNEELQATLQELTDLQKQLTELQQDNEHLLEEKNLMFESLCRQTERLTDARNEVESLKKLLYRDKDESGHEESSAEREQKLVDLLKNAQMEREMLLVKQEQLNNEVQEVRAVFTQRDNDNMALTERVRTLECTLDAKHAEHKQLDQDLARAKDKSSSRQIEIDRLSDLLENARTKILDLEQDRALSDKSELDEMLDNARKEKDALESELANLKEQLARARNEKEKLREQVSILQEECKVLRNNAKCTQSELEYKVDILTADKNALLEQLQGLEEAANELQVQAQCQLEDKRQLSSVLSETQRNMSEVERRNKELEMEVKEIRKLRNEENEEWEKFQNDLLTSVRVANDFKNEAQQELQNLVLENKAHRDKIRLLESQIEKLKDSVGTAVKDVRELKMRIKPYNSLEINNTIEEDNIIEQIENGKEKGILSGHMSSKSGDVEQEEMKINKSVHRNIFERVEKSPTATTIEIRSWNDRIVAPNNFDNPSMESNDNGFKSPANEVSGRLKSATHFEFKEEKDKRINLGRPMVRMEEKRLEPINESVSKYDDPNVQTISHEHRHEYGSKNETNETNNKASPKPIDEIQTNLKANENQNEERAEKRETLTNKSSLFNSNTSTNTEFGLVSNTSSLLNQNLKSNHTQVTNCDLSKSSSFSPNLSKHEIIFSNNETASSSKHLELLINSKSEVTKSTTSPNNLSKREEYYLKFINDEYSKIDPSISVENLQPDQQLIVKLKRGYDRHFALPRARPIENKKELAISKPLLASVYDNPKLKEIVESDDVLNLENVDIFNTLDYASAIVDEVKESKTREIQNTFENNSRKNRNDYEDVFEYDSERTSSEVITQTPIVLGYLNKSKSKSLSDLITEDTIDRDVLKRAFVSQLHINRDSNMSDYQDSVIYDCSEENYQYFEDHNDKQVSKSIKLPKSRGFEKKKTAQATVTNSSELIRLYDQIDKTKPEDELSKEELYVIKLKSSLDSLGRKNTLKRTKMKKNKLSISSPILDSVMTNEKLACIIENPGIAIAHSEISTTFGNFSTSTPDFNEQFRKENRSSWKDRLKMRKGEDKKKIHTNKKFSESDDMIYRYSLNSGAIKIEARSEGDTHLSSTGSYPLRTSTFYTFGINDSGRSARSEGANLLKQTQKHVKSASLSDIQFNFEGEEAQGFREAKPYKDRDKNKKLSSTLTHYLNHERNRISNRNSYSNDDRGENRDFSYTSKWYPNCEVNEAETNQRNGNICLQPHCLKHSNNEITLHRHYHSNPNLPHIKENSHDDDIAFHRIIRSGQKDLLPDCQLASNFHKNLACEFQNSNTISDDSNLQRSSVGKEIKTDSRNIQRSISEVSTKMKLNDNLEVDVKRSWLTRKTLSVTDLAITKECNIETNFKIDQDLTKKRALFKRKTLSVVDLERFKTNDDYKKSSEEYAKYCQYVLQNIEANRRYEPQPQDGTDSLGQIKVIQGGLNLKELQSVNNEKEAKSSEPQYVNLNISKQNEIGKISKENERNEDPVNKYGLEYACTKKTIQSEAEEDGLYEDIEVVIREKKQEVPCSSIVGQENIEVKRSSVQNFIRNFETVNNSETIGNTEQSRGNLVTVRKFATPGINQDNNNYCIANTGIKGEDVNDFMNEIVQYPHNHQKGQKLENFETIHRNNFMANDGIERSITDNVSEIKYPEIQTSKPAKCITSLVKAEESVKNDFPTLRDNDEIQEQPYSFIFTETDEKVTEVHSKKEDLLSPSQKYKLVMRSLRKKFGTSECMNLNDNHEYLNTAERKSDKDAVNKLTLTARNENNCDEYKNVGIIAKCPVPKPRNFDDVNSRKRLSVQNLKTYSVDNETSKEIYQSFLELQRQKSIEDVASNKYMKTNEFKEQGSTEDVASNTSLNINEVKFDSTSICVKNSLNEKDKNLNLTRNLPQAAPRMTKYGTLSNKLRRRSWDHSYVNEVTFSDLRQKYISESDRSENFPNVKPLDHEASDMSTVNAENNIHCDFVTFKNEDNNDSALTVLNNSQNSDGLSSKERASISHAMEKNSNSDHSSTKCGLSDFYTSDDVFISYQIKHERNLVEPNSVRDKIQQFLRSSSVETNFVKSEEAERSKTKLKRNKHFYVNALHQNRRKDAIKRSISEDIRFKMRNSVILEEQHFVNDETTKGNNTKNVSSDIMEHTRTIFSSSDNISKNEEMPHSDERQGILQNVNNCEEDLLKNSNYVEITNKKIEENTNYPNTHDFLRDTSLNNPEENNFVIVESPIEIKDGSICDAARRRNGVEIIEILTPSDENQGNDDYTISFQESSDSDADEVEIEGAQKPSCEPYEVDALTIRKEVEKNKFVEDSQKLNRFKEKDGKDELMEDEDFSDRVVGVNVDVDSNIHIKKLGVLDVMQSKDERLSVFTEDGNCVKTEPVEIDVEANLVLRELTKNFLLIEQIMSECYTKSKKVKKKSEKPRIVSSAFKKDNDQQICKNNPEIIITPTPENNDLVIKNEFQWVDACGKSVVVRKDENSVKKVFDGVNNSKIDLKVKSKDKMQEKLPDEMNNSDVKTKSLFEEVGVSENNLMVESIQENLADVQQNTDLKIKIGLVDLNAIEQNIKEDESVKKLFEIPMTIKNKANLKEELKDNSIKMQDTPNDSFQLRNRTEMEHDTITNNSKMHTSSLDFKSPNIDVRQRETNQETKKSEIVLNFEKVSNNNNNSNMQEKKTDVQVKGNISYESNISDVDYFKENSFNTPVNSTESTNHYCKENIVYKKSSNITNSKPVADFKKIAKMFEQKCLEEHTVKRFLENQYQNSEDSKRGFDASTKYKSVVSSQNSENKEQEKPTRYLSKKGEYNFEVKKSKEEIPIRRLSDNFRDQFLSKPKTENYLMHTPEVNELKQVSVKSLLCKFDSNLQKEPALKETTSVYGRRMTKSVLNKWKIVNIEKNVTIEKDPQK